MDLAGLHAVEQLLLAGMVGGVAFRDVGINDIGIVFVGRD